MTDQEFRDMLFTALAEIKEQGKERYERLEKHFDIIEAQRKADNERLGKRLDAIETQREKDNERLEKRLDSLDNRLGTVEHDVGWIKGKLEGKQESNGKVLNVSILGASTVAIIIALIALFN